ncbi:MULTISPECIES: hypothetical protein [unclassified Streptomyces]|uniref:hypothetical protein n=1 Tax=unclassified Streptomyces TaxID=2593676 RepID=UPI000DB9A420|nr:MULTISPECIES: hypothetical protein [unclassified Streptomyces]MYT70363.1 hypothetical protein [Streptomyces sp. SID8367]RAJ70551.1 hypothetical protein K377_07961 [Streptomyces sp. PsTaAH-137]
MVLRISASDWLALLPHIAEVLLVILLFVLGAHALVEGQAPGRLLQNTVRRPRIWGAGALLAVAAFGAHAVWLLAIAVSVMILGHTWQRPR